LSYNSNLRIKHSSFIPFIEIINEKKSFYSFPKITVKSSFIVTVLSIVKEECKRNDIFDAEPLPADHPLRTAPRLLATPHLGYVTRDNYRRYYGQAVENIQAYLAGEPLRRLP